MEIWLVIGREMNKNSLKHLHLLSNIGNRKVMTVSQLSSFSSKNKVVNVKCYGDQLQGVGISLLQIPTYKKDKMGQLVQCGGTSEQYIINAAQPFINEIMMKEQKTNEEKNRLDADTQKKIEYIVKKLEICYRIINELENTKTITNEKLLLERVTRYTKQLDIDSADDSIENMIAKYGITGLVRSVEIRISKCKERAKKYNLLNIDIKQTGSHTVKGLCEMMQQRLENVKKMHKITYDIIKDGKTSQEPKPTEEPKINANLDDSQSIQASKGKELQDKLSQFSRNQEPKPVEEQHVVDEVRQQNIAKNEEKLAGWIQNEREKSSQIQSNDNPHISKLIQQGNEAINEGLNGPNGDRYKFILYHLLNIEKKSGEKLNYDRINGEDTLIKVVEENLLKEPRPKGTNILDWMLECGNNAPQYVKDVKWDILRSRGIDPRAIYWREQEMMREDYYR